MLVTMSVNTQKTAARILKRNKIQKILQFWKNDPTRWVQSCKLREEFVKSYQNFAHREDDGRFYTFDRYSNEGRIYDKRPMALYNNDSELYRDLKDMFGCGLLDKKEVKQKKGIPESYYRPSKKYRLEPLKIWHKDCIMNTNINNMVPTVSNLLFYFSNEGISVDHPSFTKEDFVKINTLSKKISESLNEITDVFISIGKRKAITICVDVIENFNLIDAFKEFFYICIISDFATGLRFHGYDFSQIVENSKEQFVWLEPAATIYNIIISAAVQFIKQKYDLTEIAFQQFLKDSNEYRNLHSFIGEIFRDFITSYSSYTIVGEKPSLFRGNEKPLFSDNDITKFKACRNLSNLDKLAKKIKNKKYISPFEPYIEIMKIEPFLAETKKQADIVFDLSQVLQKNLVKKAEKNNGQLIYKGKPSFFEEMTFLDKYNTLGDFFPKDTPLIDGYENTLKDYKFDKGKVYNDLKKWADLFSS